MQACVYDQAGVITTALAIPNSACTTDALLEQLSDDASTLEVSVDFSIDELEPILEDMAQAGEIAYSGGVVRASADAYESEGSPVDMDTAR